MRGCAYISTPPTLLGFKNHHVENGTVCVVPNCALISLDELHHHARDQPATPNTVDSVGGTATCTVIPTILSFLHASRSEWLSKRACLEPRIHACSLAQRVGNLGARVGGEQVTEREHSTAHTSLHSIHIRQILNSEALRQRSFRR
jgi:hypothetical protein